MNKKITFALIAHNESLVLKECLESIKWADEIIFVDCESQDNSIEIASNYTSKIYKRKNERAVYINKQFAIDQSSGDWIFIIDPDERISQELKEEIKNAIENEEFSAYSMPRKNYYFGKWIKYGGKYPDTQLRLFKKGKAKFPKSNVHPKIKVDGKISKLKNPLIHLTVKDTFDYLKKLDFFSSNNANRYLNDKRTIFSAFIRPFSRFISNYVLKLGFLEGKIGFFVAVMDFLTLFFSAIRYWEKLKK